VGRIICTQESNQQSERRAVIFDEAPQQFQEQLSSSLQGEEYQNAVPNLQGEHLVPPVEHLDSVSPRTSPPTSCPTPASNVDTPLPPPSPGLDPTQHLPDPSISIDPQEQAWQRLIARAAPHDELPSLIETILSESTTNVIDRLSETDAQAFIDVMDEVRRHAHYF